MTWMIVLGTIVPFFLIVGSMRHITATRAGILAMVEPVVASLVAWAWLGETLNGDDAGGRRNRALRRSSSPRRPAESRREKIGRTAYWQRTRPRNTLAALGDANCGRPLADTSAVSTRKSPLRRPPRAAGFSVLWGLSTVATDTRCRAERSYHRRRWLRGCFLPRLAGTALASNGPSRPSSRALELHGPPVYVRRQIVHNAHVVRELERRGAVFVESEDEPPPGSLIVLSAHGVAPAVHDRAAARRLRTIDAVCPLVTRVHAAVTSVRSGRLFDPAGRARRITRRWSGRAGRHRTRSRWSRPCSTPSASRYRIPGGSPMRRRRPCPSTRPLRSLPSCAGGSPTSPGPTRATSVMRPRTGSER